MINSIEAITLLVFVMMGAFGLGSIALIKIGFCDHLQPEFHVYSFALGLGLISHLMFLLGILGLFTPQVAWLALIIGASIGLIEIIRNRRDYLGFLKKIILPVKVNWYLVCLLFLLLTQFIYPLLANALVPPLSYDEVAYHLAIPKIYIQNHRITYISFIPYSNWPLETELLFTFGLLLGSESLTHLIVWANFLLITAALIAFGKRYFSTEIGILAAMIFAYTPVVTTLSGMALVELPLTLFTLLSSLCLVEWLNSHDRRLWILSALFGGLAASTKLNAALVPLILGLLSTVGMRLYWKSGPREILKHFIYYGLISFIIVAPWYAKTWIMTGNPFWPFLQNIFHTRDWDSLGLEYLMRFIQNPNMPLTPVNWLIGIWKLANEPAKYGSYRFALGWLYVLLLPVAIPIIIIRGRKNLLAVWLVIIGVVFYTSWFFQTHQTRFLMPALSVFALITSIGVSWLFNVSPKIWVILQRFCLLALFIVFNWLASPNDRSQVVGNLPFIMGDMTRNQYLKEHIPGYRAYIYANEDLPSNAYILLALFESRGYFLERKYMWINPISQRALPLEGYKNADELAIELEALGFTHVLFRTDFVDRFINIRYGEILKSLTFGLLSQHARLIYSAPPYELYELTH